MKIESYSFVKSSSKATECPQNIYPEFAFIGRSNVGKSSLINTLTGSKKLAKISGTPGKTLLINHFLINNNWYLVDLPGFGYAKASKKEKRKIEEIISNYFYNRIHINLTYLLIDSRLKPQNIDIEFMLWLNENNLLFKLIFTKSDKLNKKEIANLLPHREPMLLIDELYDIKKLSSAKAVVNVKKDSFFVNGHFPDNPVMPGVLIVESFGQAAAALTAHGLDRSTYENKLVFLMGVEKARFRNPVIPDCKLILEIEAIRSHGRVWKYKGEAFVDEIKMADAIWSATIVDKK